MLVNKKIESTMDIKRMNVRKVIDSFLKLGQSTKSEISRDSGLSISTCSTIIKELLTNGDLIECGHVKTLGRPSQTYTYNANRSLALCISIVVNKKTNSIKYALVNMKGTIIDSNNIEKEEITLEEFYAIIDRVSESNNIDAIGIAIPGMVYNGVIDYCDVQSLEGIDLQNTLEKKYNIKVIVENEMHLKAYGYYKNHPELGYEIVAILNLPEGHTCGAGLIINGQVLEGKSNFAGEINYLPFAASRDDLISKSSDRNTLIPLLSKIVISLISIANPAHMVFVGMGFDDDIVNKVKKSVDKKIPAHYQPEYYLQRDISKEYLDGIVLFTQETIR